MESEGVVFTTLEYLLLLEKSPILEEVKTFAGITCALLKRLSNPVYDKQ